MELGWPYVVAMVFLGTYPVLCSLLWIAGSAAFSFFREGTRADESFYELEHQPRVSVLIAAFDEELTIGRTLEAVMALEWPDLEVVVVDDGSTDRTPDIVRRYADDPRVELVIRERNGGKAAALNEGLLHVTSDLVLMMDADGAPAADALHWMVPHLQRLPHVAAVTGNPRVANTRTLLWLPLFPLLYWILLALAAVRGTLPGAVRTPRGPVTWHIPRTQPQE